MIEAKYSSDCYCLKYLDFLAVCANLSGALVAATQFGLPYFWLAVEAADAAVSADNDAPMIRLRSTELTNRGPSWACPQKVKIPKHRASTGLIHFHLGRWPENHRKTI